MTSDLKVDPEKHTVFCHHVATNDENDELMRFKESSLKIRKNISVQKLTVSKDFFKIRIPFRMIVNGPSSSGMGFILM